MKQSVLSAWDLPGLSILALILFVVCFALYVWWTFRKKNKAAYEEAAQIPLEEANVILPKKDNYE